MGAGLAKSITGRTKMHSATPDSHNSLSSTDSSDVDCSLMYYRNMEGVIPNFDGDSVKKSRNRDGVGSGNKPVQI